MMRLCTPSDVEMIYWIINDAAQAYKGVIPTDRWHEPYMTREQLNSEMDDGVVFWGLERDGELVGVMGIQDRGDVHLIRHAYVVTTARRQGIGMELLRHLESRVSGPILVGTWATADWAVSFYEKAGYRLVSAAEKNRLLRKYWNIPERQVETSVVLANGRWTESGS
jgi:N-acetylglutamate synthase-like GNAT family acetyltransferase